MNWFGKSREKVVDPKMSLHDELEQDVDEMLEQIAEEAKKIQTKQAEESRAPFGAFAGRLTF